jgi:ferredoxin
MIIAGDSRRIYTQEIITRRLKNGKKSCDDTEECIGCESCVELCSDVFAFNEEEEKAEVIMPEGGPEDCIEEAMDTCPVECIHWEDD